MLLERKLRLFVLAIDTQKQLQKRVMWEKSNNLINFLYPFLLLLDQIRPKYPEYPKNCITLLDPIAAGSFGPISRHH